MIEFYLPGGAPAGPLVFTGLEAGSDSDVIAVEAWHSRGVPGGSARTNVRFVLEAQDPGSPGVWISSGLPPLDELWGRYRLVGVANPGDPTWTVALTDWRLFGAGRAIEIPRVPADCGVLLELRMRPPSSAAATSYSWRVVPIYSEFSRPRPPGLPGRGVLYHHGDRRRSYAIRGCDLTASPVPDDEVHVAAGLWLHRGSVRGKVATSHQLDQSDSSAAALAEGESYIAAILLDGDGVLVVKGDKGAAPAAPAIAAEDVFLGLVVVEHGAGGSVIDPADLSGTPARGRFHVEPAGGLGIRVYPGEAVAGETLRYQDLAQVLAVPDDSDLSLWILSTGHLDLEVDPPEETAEELWRAVTAGGSVTLLEDRRRPAEAPTVLELGGALLGAPGVVAGRWWDGPPLELESVVARVSEAGAGATSGQTKLDVLVDGVSVFDTALEDLRPAFAFDATEFRQDPIHQRPLIPKGALLELVTVEHPVDGAPAAVAVSLSLI